MSAAPAKVHSPSTPSTPKDNDASTSNNKMKNLPAKIRLKSGKDVLADVFAQDLIQLIRKKDWKTAITTLNNCESIPCDNAHIIEVFLRFSRTTQINIIDKLLKLGVDVNCSLAGQSALSLAIELGNTKMVKALLKRGIDVNKCPLYTKKEKSAHPLFSAILEASEAEDHRDRKSMIEIIKSLITAGAVISDKKEMKAINAIMNGTDCDELKQLCSNVVFCSANQKTLSPKAEVLSCLIGKYQIDIEATIKYKMGTCVLVSKNEQEKLKSQFRLEAKQLQDIHMALTKHELIISSSGGTERYSASCKKQRGKIILNVQWGILTPFLVRQFGNDFYHFDREGNTISGVIWKKI